MERRGQRMWWAAVGAIALIGLALRLLAARGGLWTDEAWSVIYAAQAQRSYRRVPAHQPRQQPPSLFALAAGDRTRRPAHACSRAGDPRRNIVRLCCRLACRTAIARLRASSRRFCSQSRQSFVAFGSEARGYAMMLLAALTMLLLVDDALDGRPARGAPWWIAVFALLGMFSHMTMAAPRRNRGAVGLSRMAGRSEVRAKHCRRQLGSWARRSWQRPAVILFVFTAAELSPTGMRLGGYEPFSCRTLRRGARRPRALVFGICSAWPWFIPICLGGLALLDGCSGPFGSARGRVCTLC